MFVHSRPSNTLHVHYNQTRVGCCFIAQMASSSGESHLCQKVVFQRSHLMFALCRSAIACSHIKASMVDAGRSDCFQHVFGRNPQLHCALLPGPSQGQRVEHCRHWLHHWHLSVDHGNQRALAWALRECSTTKCRCNSAFHRWPASAPAASFHLVSAFALQRLSSSVGCPNCHRLPLFSCPPCLCVP